MGQISDRWTPWFAIPLVASLGWIIVCLRLWWRFLRARHFPTTGGTVLSRQVVREVDGEGGVSYSVELSFTYTVAGRDYTSSRYHSLGGWGGSKKAAERAVEDFAVGQAVQIFYDPADPGFAFVRNGPLANIYLPIVGLLGLWGIGWYCYRHAT